MDALVKELRDSERGRTLVFVRTKRGADRLAQKLNRRNINADENLRPIFGRSQVSMFEMTKLVSGHIKA